MCVCVSVLNVEQVERYSEALETHLEAEWLVQMSAELRWCARRTMMSLGLAIGSLVCVTYVNRGTFTVGDYALFVSYLQQVQQLEMLFLV